MRRTLADEVAEALQSVRQQSSGGPSKQVSPNRRQCFGRFERPGHFSGLTRRVVGGLAVVLVAVAAVGTLAALLLPPDSDQTVAESSQTPPSVPDTDSVRDTERGQQPPRVQVVTPDELMREQIRDEKEQTPREQSPELVREFVGHTGPVGDVVFLPDGAMLLSCSGWPMGDRTIRLWNVETGEEIRQFDTEDAPQNPYFSGPLQAPPRPVNCGSQCRAGFAGR